jgi:antimicrobial peptide system SdpA family protein
MDKKASFTDNPPTGPTRTFSFGAAAILMGYALLGAYSLHGSMPHNPVALPGEGQIRMVQWLPQGWSFFTADGRAERSFAFLKRDDGWTLAVPLHNASPATLFGVDRSRRAQGAELGGLFGRVPVDAWTPCSGTLDACLDAANVSLQISSLAPFPTLCGEVGLVAQRPVPYAWARAGGDIVMPSRVAKLRVTC